MDGVKYDVVTTATDTLAVTNIAGAQVHTWKLTGNLFQYYKATCKGGNRATHANQHGKHNGPVYREELKTFQPGRRVKVKRALLPSGVGRFSL